MNKINLNYLRKQILLDAKKPITLNGWSRNIFYEISRKSKFTYNEITTLFPNGYKQLLETYLNSINIMMTEESKKTNFIRLKVHQRIRKLILIRLNIMNNEKKLISNTYLHLLMPQNFKLAFKCLYKTVDQIWFLSGDNSTDFNFYSKRAILGSIYTNTLMHFINNDNIDETIKLLDNQLKQVSQIPKLKNKIKDSVSNIPYIFKFLKNTKAFKR